MDCLHLKGGMEMIDLGEAMGGLGRRDGDA